MMGSATVADDHATNDETYHHPFLPQMKKNILPQMMRRAIIRHMPQWQIIMPQMMRHATVADNHATNDETCHLFFLLQMKKKHYHI